MPFDFLDSGKNFEEHLIVHGGTANKFKITTVWEDAAERHIKRANGQFINQEVTVVFTVGESVIDARTGRVVLIVEVHELWGTTTCKAIDMTTNTVY